MGRIKGTESQTRRHVFIPFTERVAAVRIDPIRRVTNKSRLDESVAHFPASLERWRELNLSRNFSNFADKAWPLGRSLPLILHNQKELFDLLAIGIEALDVYSAEPLLDLLTHFAFDLGPEFETYFARTLSLLMDAVMRFISAADAGEQKNSIETVERIFNCLAYLFKYLSRLLVTDLCPTYDYLAPLFGRERKQRTYVIRFAAEAMSFLIRKCQGDSLSRIIEHIVDGTATGSAQYSVATSMLLVNTLKGPGVTLHSKTPQIIGKLLLAASERAESQATELCANVVAGGLHHSRLETSSPLVEAVLTNIPTISDKNKNLAFLLLAVLAGLRKGDRISDWKGIWDSYLSVLGSHKGQLTISATLAGALLLGRSDFGATTKLHDQFISQLMGRLPDAGVLSLFSTVAELDQSSFVTFAAQRLIAATRSNTMDNVSALFLSKILPSVPTDRMPPPPKTLTKLPLPKSPSQLMSFWWRQKSFSGTCLPATANDLNVILSLVPDCQSNQEQMAAAAALTQGLRAFSGTASEASDLAVKVMCVDLSDIARAPLLEALERLISKSELNGDICNLATSLASKFASHWHLPLRRAAMSLAASVAVDKDTKTLCHLAISVDEISHDTVGARAIALAVRALSTAYSGANPQKSEMICRFLFGLSSSRFQPAWQAGVEALPLAAERHPNVLWSLAQSWIVSPPRAPKGDPLMSSIEPAHLEVPDCTFLERAKEALMNNWRDFAEPELALQKQLQEWSKIDDNDSLRTAAIRALAAAPALGEQHGDSLVPYLLAPGDDDNGPVSFSDRHALLELFAKFQRPKQLKNWVSIRKQYEYFLGSRHLPLQKLAIKCILSANDATAQTLRRYRANLDALTDEQRFKDEITSLMAANMEESGEEHGVHENDREEIMPVILRLLFGRAQTARSKSGSEKSGQRHAVLVALSTHCRPHEHALFLDLATERARDAPMRVQQGMLSLLLDYVHEIKSGCSPNLDILVGAAIAAVQAAQSATEEEQATKTVRQNAVKLITELLVTNKDASAWRILFPKIYQTIILPRCESFGYKNREQVSAMLLLFKTLCEHAAFAAFAEYSDGSIISALASCLKEDNTKPQVLSLVFQSFDHLLTNSRKTYLPAFGKLMVTRLPQLLDSLPTQQLQEAILLFNKLIAEDCATASDSETNELVSVMLSLFEQTNTRNIPVATRAEILVVLSRLLARDTVGEQVIRDAYLSLSRLFRQLSDRRARLGLSQTFAAFGERIRELKRVGDLILELNAYDKRRIDTPDFDRRLAAFSCINERLFSEFTAVEWLPILQNMLFFIKDPEELALRNNAVYTLKQYVNAGAPGSLMADVLLPAIRLGVRDDRESIRKLYVEVLAHAVTTLDKDKLGECITLVNLGAVEGEEETDFFYNLFHIQQHRRRRAMRRLSRIAASGAVASSALAHFVLPLVEHYAALANSKDSEKNALGEEALEAIATITPELAWSQYRAVSIRYISQVRNKPQELRKTTRLVTCVAKALAKAAEQETLASPTQIESFVLKDALNPLHSIMAAPRNDEQNLPDRVGLALPIVWFIRALPPSKIEEILPGKLVWLCQLFRSKSQELRDLARSTLAKVSSILGSRYLRFILGELRSALRKGAQAHVLGFTVHALLLETRPSYKPGDLDASAPLITDVVLEEIFGRVGDEKDAEGYNSGSREVKQNKSFDSAEILASNLTLNRFNLLLGPIEDVLLAQRLDSKREKKATELFRRIGMGMRANKDFLSQDTLIMAYQVFDSAVKKQAAAKEVAKTRAAQDAMQGLEGADRGPASDREAALNAAKAASEEYFTVRLSSRHWEQRKHAADRYIEQLHLVQAFALEVLQVALSSSGGGGTQLLTHANAAGLLPLLAQAAESRHSNVQAAALRLAATVVKAVPMGDDGNEIASTLARRAVEIARQTPSSSEPLFQAALKTLSALLGARSECVSDEAIEYILERVLADIEEPDRQGASLGFVRSVLARQAMLPQVYDTLNRVREVMVTNANSATRGACRAAFLQFLTEYPHSRRRFERQLEYLIGQLQYPGSAGRLSALELLTALLRKAGGAQLKQQLESVMVANVLLLANEDDEDCRAQGIKLAEAILLAATQLPERAEGIRTLCRKWLEGAATNDVLARVVLQIALIDEGFAVPGLGVKKSEAANILEPLRGNIEALALSSTQRSARDTTDDAPWQLLYLSLQFLECRARESALSVHQLDAVENALLFPHAWVRAVASRVIGAHFGHVNPDSKEQDPAELLVHRFVRQLGAPRLSEADGLQIVKNIVFVVKRWQPDATIAARDGPRPAVQWLAHKLCALVRAEWSHPDGGEEAAKGSKTAAVQALAALPQLLRTSQLNEVVDEILGALYLLSESEEHATLAAGALSIYEKAMGVTDYLKAYSKARQAILNRRLERKTKRAIEAVQSPARFAEKRIRKNAKTQRATKRAKQMA